MANEYYRAYEERYRIVRSVTEEIWGHSPEDDDLAAAIGCWVKENDLAGKRVMEFACGEGACAVLLGRAGCIYHGADIAPTALETAKKLAGGMENVSFSLMDLVRESAGEAVYSAALDVSGLHMLVTDSDRAAYLKNMYNALVPGGCAMFWQESFRIDAYEGEVHDFADWERRTGLDFNTPEKRTIGESGREVMLKLLPARPRTEAGYRAEMEKAGFVVEEIRPIADNGFMAMSACIKVRKPL